MKETDETEAGRCFLGISRFSLSDLRMEHQGKGFMGCDYNLDEVFLTINGVRHDLWRAVDQDGHILDILVQRRRDKSTRQEILPQAAQRLPVRPARSS